MSVKSIVIKALAGCLIIALLAGAIFLLTRDEEEKVKEEIIVYSDEKEAVIKVGITGSESFSFTRRGEAWVMDSLEGVEVKKANVNALVASMTKITGDMLVEEECKDLSKYGLDKPTLAVTLTFADKEEKILVGKVSGEYYYVKLASDNDVYIVNKQNLYMAFLEKMRFVKNAPVEVKAASLTKIKIGDVLLEKEAGVWFLKSPYDRIADPERVNSVISSLSSIEAVEILKKEEKAVDNAIAVSLSHGEEEQRFFVVRGENEAYIYFEDSEYVYVINSSMADFLSVTGFDLSVKNIIMEPFTKVSRIEFVSQKGRNVITIDAPDSEMPVFYKNGIEIEEKDFKNLYQKMAMLTVDGEIAAPGAAECAVIIKKTNGETIDIRFIKSTDLMYAVSINGVTQFAIAKNAVNEVFDALDEIQTE